MRSIYGVTYQQLEEFLIANGEKKYRASQIFTWLYEKNVQSFEEMSNIGASLQTLLQTNYYFEKLELVKEEDDVDVSKYLFRLNDKELIETVLMRHDYGNSLCISSQVGCNMNCSFCQSGKRKKQRNLTTSEMICQIRAVASKANIRISHVVIMGIGEPFDNYDNVINFLILANDYRALNIGSRHLTVSTCGIVPKIYEFANLPLQVNLAISLHAPNNELRSQLMPINKVYPIEELMQAIKFYLQKTNRRVTFEYILLDGINDREEDAIELASLLQGLECYVNLIPYNESDGNYKRSKRSQIMKFYDIIKKRKVQVTIRREFGIKISAACGQLRSQKEE